MGTFAPTWQQVTTAAQAKNGWTDDQLNAEVETALDSAGGSATGQQLADLLGITQDDINRYGGATVSTPSQVDQIADLENRVRVLENRVSVIEQREALTMDAIAKMIANRILGLAASELEGPGSAAGDVDAVEAKPAVEQQVQSDQSTT